MKDLRQKFIEHFESVAKNRMENSCDLPKEKAIKFWLYKEAVFDFLDIAGPALEFIEYVKVSGNKGAKLNLGAEQIISNLESKLKSNVRS